MKQSIVFRLSESLRKLFGGGGGLDVTHMHNTHTIYADRTIKRQRNYCSDTTIKLMTHESRLQSWKCNNQLICTHM